MSEKLGNFSRPRYVLRFIASPSKQRRSYLYFDESIPMRLYRAYRTDWQECQSLIVEALPPHQPPAASFVRSISQFSTTSPLPAVSNGFSRLHQAQFLQMLGENTHHILASAPYSKHNSSNSSVVYLHAISMEWEVTVWRLGVSLLPQSFEKLCFVYRDSGHLDLEALCKSAVLLFPSEPKPAVVWLTHK